MADNDKSPVVKKRCLDVNLLSHTSAIDSDSDDSQTSEKMESETLWLSTISISDSEEIMKADTITIHDKNDSNSGEHKNDVYYNNNGDVDEDDNEDDNNKDTNNQDKVTDNHDNVAYPLLSRECDDISSNDNDYDNDGDELYDNRKLMVATQKLALPDGKYFGVIMDESTLTGTVVANCELCDSPKLFKGSLRSTSNLTFHLKVIVILSNFLQQSNFSSR